MNPAHYTRAELLAEFEHTRSRHGGKVSIAAPILGMTTVALARALWRAKNAGIDVQYHDDTQRMRRGQVSA